MSERILELADKIYSDNQALMGEQTNIPDQFCLLFAEAIVKECASIVNSLEQHEGRGDCSIAEYIKEHFGVN